MKNFSGCARSYHRKSVVIFRFKEDSQGGFINVSQLLKIPPLTDIRELIAASQEIEKSEEANIIPERKWLKQLVQSGSSLGGARPKASVVDTERMLYVAKFPSRKDDYDANLRELYRRVTYNICIGNSDDHFRNHGFLLTPKGWRLSPAYDMNPTLNDHQSLLISASSSQSDLGILLDACEEYMLDA